MKEWIKELEENAAVQYRKNNSKGSMYSKYPGVVYAPEIKSFNDLLYLNGAFSIPQLEALIQHMKRYQ